MKTTRALPAVLLLCSSPVLGQRSPEPPPTAPAAPVELSPFLVDATKDVGYQAGNTTSGSRLNTSLRDTAATLQVFTPEFLQDLGANNLAEVLAYGTSVQPDLGDTSPDYGGSANGRPDTGRQDFAFKSRGLDTSRMVDFFNTSAPPAAPSTPAPSARCPSATSTRSGPRSARGTVGASRPTSTRCSARTCSPGACSG